MNIEWLKLHFQFTSSFFRIDSIFQNSKLRVVNFIIMQPLNRITMHHIVSGHLPIHQNILKLVVQLLII